MVGALAWAYAVLAALALSRCSGAADSSLSGMKSAPGAQAAFDEDMPDRPWDQIPAAERYRRLNQKFFRAYEPSGAVRFENLDYYIERFVMVNIIDPKTSVFEVRGERLGKKGARLTGKVLLTEYQDGLTTTLARLGYEPVINDVKVLPDPSLGETRHGLVTTHTLTLYRNPNVRSERLDEAWFGDGVRLLESSPDGKWFRVIASDGYTGWAQAKGIRRVNLAEWKLYFGAPRQAAAARPLAFEAKNKEIVTIPTGAVLPILEDAGATAQGASSGDAWPQNDSFIYARATQADRRGRHSRRENGQDASSGAAEPAPPAPKSKPAPARNPEDRVIALLPFGGGQSLAIPREFVRIVQENGEQDKEWIINQSTPLIGVKYSWGGISESGVDCSGLTQYLHRLRGISIARDADEQSVGGRIMAWRGEGFDLLRPGDLLFFCHEQGRISHVAMSLGGTEFVHSSRDRVQWGSLDAANPLFQQNYLDHFYCAKRYSSGVK